jgi:hypothetical protein
MKMLSLLSKTKATKPALEGGFVALRFLIASFHFCLDAAAALSALLRR